MTEAELAERWLEFDGYRGVLWLPATASPSAPVPLILAGQPGGPAGLEQTHDRMRARALAAARAGFATATIELPGSGGRPQPEGVADARAQLRAAVQAGDPVPAEVIDALILPLVAQAVPEWQAALRRLLELPEVREPVGVSGGVISIATQLAAVEPRITCAVLFAGSFVPTSIIETAHTVEIPIHMLLQWDDEGNDRGEALELFDAFGSHEKTLTANLGGHTGVPSHAGDAANAFFARHLR